MFYGLPRLSFIFFYAALRSPARSSLRDLSHVSRLSPAADAPSRSSIQFPSAPFRAAVFHRMLYPSPSFFVFFFLFILLLFLLTFNAVFLLTLKFDTMLYAIENCIILWNFFVGFLTTMFWGKIVYCSSFSTGDLLKSTMDMVMGIVGGVVTAIILTMFKKWGIQQYNLRKQKRKPRRKY